jgi:plasmid replication initiation protein
LDKLIAKAQKNAAKAEKKRVVDVRKQAGREADLPSNQVTKSNQLTRAYYRFGLNEKRVMEAAISKLDGRWDKDAGAPKVTITGKEFASAFGISEKNAYSFLHDSVTNLMRKILTIRESEDKYEEYTLLTYAGYSRGEGKVSFRFNDEIVHHLIGLKGKYHTSYKLLDGANFSSSYTWRVFEILASWAKPREVTGGLFAGWIEIEVSELRRQLGVPDSYRWDRFNDRVLKVVQQELLEQANIQFKYDKIKSGRTIKSLMIKFAEDEQMSLL